jgi:hypothetical protein
MSTRDKGKGRAPEGLAPTRARALTALGTTSGSGSPPRSLSGDERFVLDHFAADHDYKRTWKAELRDEWARAMTGYARVYPDAASVLQRLRTASYFGVRGLDTYKAGQIPRDFDARLNAYLDAPSAVRWERTYSLLVPGTFRTIWQAWLVIDASAPTSKAEHAFWTVFPDAFTTQRAVKAAREGHVPVGLQALDEAHQRAPHVPRAALAPEDPDPDQESGE